MLIQILEQGQKTVDIMSHRKVCPLGFDYAIDTGGAEQLINAASSCLAKLGKCVVLAQVPSVTVSGYAYVGGTRSLSGVGYGAANPQVFILRMLRLYKRGKFPVEQIIKTYPLEDIQKAIDVKAAGKIIKPVIVMP